MSWIGIDPGLSGGVAVISAEGKLDAIRMPTAPRGGRTAIDAAYLSHWINTRATGLAEVAIEQVSARPGQGVSSMFAFGRSLGIVEGIVATLHIPCTLVPPAVWKRALQCPKEKAAARARASELFPTEAWRWQKAVEDGVAEAALIALWCRKASQTVANAGSTSR